MIKEYFSFTRKERNAVIVLVIVVVILFLLPYWIPEKVGQPIQITHLPTAPSRSTVNADELQEERQHENKTVHFSKTPTQQLKPFPFDPNSLSEEGWRKLGLREKTILTIQRYLSKGGKFRQPDDLLKIYGLKTEEAKELVPFVRINSADGEARHSKQQYEVYGDDKNGNVAKNGNDDRKEPFAVKRSQPIDINTADSGAFERLPMIGSRLASRIIKYREKLGGFYSIDQLSEIYGLEDSSFQKIKPFLTIKNQKLETINVNAAEWKTLAQHPYVDGKLAGLILQYRQQHGNFRLLTDLKRIDLVTEEIFKRLTPYLSVD